tara:strand:+ start:24 stop:308 length:285 start_codon:yes stop_codon:yes gene_type:complete
VNFKKEALNQSSKRLSDAIANERFSEAEDWLIAHERNLQNLVVSFSKEKAYDIIQEQLDLLAGYIKKINKKKDGQAIQRIKSLMNYQKSMIPFS